MTDEQYNRLQNLLAVRKLSLFQLMTLDKLLLDTAYDDWNPVIRQLDGSARTENLHHTVTPMPMHGNGLSQWGTY